MEKSGLYAQLEHMHKKHTGAGHADTTKYEFMVHRYRDALNNFICHKDSLAQIAIVENESTARVRYNLLEKMIQPCGPKPKDPDADYNDTQMAP